MADHMTSCTHLPTALYLCTLWSRGQRGVSLSPGSRSGCLTPRTPFRALIHPATTLTLDPAARTLTRPAQVVDRFNGLNVTAFVTPGNVRFLMLHDGRSDDTIRAFFTEVYDIYLRVGATAAISCPLGARRGEQEGSNANRW